LRSIIFMVEVQAKFQQGNISNNGKVDVSIISN
jgi:hypothetical protein